MSTLKDLFDCAVGAVFVWAVWELALVATGGI